MLRIAIWTVVSLLLSSSAMADVQAYKLVKQKSSLKFVAIQNNAPVEGRFDEFDADIRFDPDLLGKSSITVEVATGSVNAGYDEVVKNLKMPAWLSTDIFPKAVFKTNKINRMPMTDNYYAEGELTLRDKKMPVTINFTMDRMDAKGATAKGYATLHRIDFGVGQGEWAKDDVVKNEVRVEFRIVADKQ